MNEVPELLKPDLYARTPDGLGLSGGKCVKCGYVFFPFQQRGCEKCGAHGEDISAYELGAGGKLVSAATVHLHAGKNRTAPFVIGVIELDSGPRVRTLLVEMPDAEQRLGEMVEAVLVEAKNKDGDPVQDLRFKPVGRAL